IYGWSRSLDCVATRWRNQFCENSKTLATNHFLPEMNHNEIMGFSHPKELLKDMVVIFLRAKRDYIRVQERIIITGSIIKNGVHRVIEVDSRGEGLIAELCSLMYIGDFISFYLAVLNGEDPTPVDEITYLKKELSKRK
ncbi:MAG: bifunctional phosphoglucose/phosphomannose isomerase, partial [Candidatus Omnitrophica bacterium]|nr:bifunctional phosphoglucose/phosphomannose isomerase [Candidatus Omnitrophota bacterium]